MFDTVIEMLSYPFMTRAFLCWITGCIMFCITGRQPCIETVFDDWGWTFSCGIWCHGDCGCDECRSAYSSNPGCYCSSDSASSNQWKCKDQRRCGNCVDFYNVTSSWRDGDLIDNRNEYGCI